MIEEQGAYLFYSKYDYVLFNMYYWYIKEGKYFILE